MEFITTLVSPQQDSFEKIFRTRTYNGDNMVHCNKCKKKTEQTSVSFDFQFKTTNCKQQYLLINTEIKQYRV